MAWHMHMTTMTHVLIRHDRMESDAIVFIHVHCTLEYSLNDGGDILLLCALQLPFISISFFHFFCAATFIRSSIHSLNHRLSLISQYTF